MKIVPIRKNEPTFSNSRNVVIFALLMVAVAAYCIGLYSLLSGVGQFARSTVGL